MINDPDIEPIPGLPRALPPGERIVWQGRPTWRALARHTFKTRWVTAYFAVFVALRFAAAVYEGKGFLGVLVGIGLSVVCLTMLFFLAWLNANATLYTVTTRRIVLRTGVALPMTWNLPFKRLAAADLTVRKEGDGDIALQLTAPNRIAWLQLWPHAQPGHLMKARPMLRAIPEPARVAKLLSEAMRTWAETAGAPVLITAAHAFIDAPVANEVDPARFDVEPKLVPEAGR